MELVEGNTHDAILTRRVTLWRRPSAAKWRCIEGNAGTHGILHVGKSLRFVTRDGWSATVSTLDFRLMSALELLAEVFE